MTQRYFCLAEYTTKPKPNQKTNPNPNPKPKPNPKKNQLNLGFVLGFGLMCTPLGKNIIGAFSALRDRTFRPRWFVGN